ncbi:MAG: preprotein translocase subunit SecG [Ruminococcus sp.]|nr:preprotein translocase subunit SecG [Ruminococcus sp.]MDE6672759.1 preprotein translocase subunit SecG [Ruminococcus sp.]
MSALEIAGGIVILLVSLVTIVICLSQEQKTQDSMTAALTGSSAESFYNENKGRSKEAILNKVTRTLAIILFVAVLAVNVIPIFTDK